MYKHILVSPSSLNYDWLINSIEICNCFAMDSVIVVFNFESIVQSFLYYKNILDRLHIHI